MNQESNSRNSGVTQTNSSATINIFLNVILVLLSAIIVYLLYSLILNIKTIAEQNDNDENKISPSKIIQLEVLNGCGTEGAADKFTGYLRENNFDVVRSGNYRSFDVDYCLVIDRTGKIANAEKVADALGISPDHIIQQLNEEYFLDVTLVIGKDFNTVKPKQEKE